MNILILLISRILSVSLNWVIVAVAVYEAYLMADTIRKLKKLRAEIMDINRTSSKKANVVERAGKDQNRVHHNGGERLEPL